jgi:hypothetical protein
MAITEVNKSGAFGELRLDGAQEFIQALTKYERKDLKQSLFKEMKDIAKPIIKDAEMFLPTQSNTLSGWGGKNTSSQVNVGPNERYKSGPTSSRPGTWGFPVYHERTAKKQLKVVVGGRSKRQKDAKGSDFYTNLLSVIQWDGAAMVFEYAGTRTNNKFARALESKGFGKPMRSLFKSVDKHRQDVQKGVMSAIIKAEQDFNDKQKKANI